MSTYSTVPTAEQFAFFSEANYEAAADIIEARILRPGSDGQSIWFQARDAVAMVPHLLRDNARQWNVYLGANPRKGHGYKGDKGVRLARCLFADADGVTLEEVLLRIESAGLPTPTLIVFTGHGYHVYWRLTEPVEDLDLWTVLQKRLILAIGSDGKIHNPERIMRAPGFLNHKKPPAVLSCIESCDPLQRYDLAHMMRILPPLARRQSDAGTVETSSSAVTRGDAGLWLAAAINKVKAGDHRNEVGFWLFCQLRDARISKSTALSLVDDFVDACPASDHPYTVEEAIHSVEEAYSRSARNPAAPDRSNGGAFQWAKRIGKGWCHGRKVVRV